MSPVRLISLPRATMTERRELQQSCLGHVQCTASKNSVPKLVASETGKCPATRPHKTTTECCGAYLGSSSTVYQYDCDSHYSSTSGVGCLRSIFTKRLCDTLENRIKLNAFLHFT